MEKTFDNDRSYDTDGETSWDQPPPYELHSSGSVLSSSAAVNREHRQMTPHHEIADDPRPRRRRYRLFLLSPRRARATPPSSASPETRCGAVSCDRYRPENMPGAQHCHSGGRESRSDRSLSPSLCPFSNFTPSRRRPTLHCPRHRPPTLRPPRPPRDP